MSVNGIFDDVRCMLQFLANGSYTVASKSTKRRRRLFVDFHFDASVDGTYG